MPRLRLKMIDDLIYEGDYLTLDEVEQEAGVVRGAGWARMDSWRIRSDTPPQPAFKDNTIYVNGAHSVIMDYTDS